MFTCTAVVPVLPLRAQTLVAMSMEPKALVGEFTRLVTS